MKLLKMIKLIGDDILKHVVPSILNYLGWVCFSITTSVFFFDVGFYWIYFADTNILGHSRLFFVNPIFVVLFCVFIGGLLSFILLIVGVLIKIYTEDWTIFIKNYLKSVKERVDKGISDRI